MSTEGFEQAEWSPCTNLGLDLIFCQVERSLLAGEWSAEEGRLRKMSYRLAVLKSGENRLAQEQTSSS